MLKGNRFYHFLFMLWLTACRAVKKQLSLSGTAILLFVLVLFFVLSFFEVRIEDSQTVLFPLALIGVWLLPKAVDFRMPGVLVVFAFLLWVASEGSEYFWVEKNVSQVYVSRLDEDSTGLKARAVFQRFNQIASTYELPPMAMLEQSFSDVNEAREWLEKNELVPFLIRGSVEWFEVVFSPNVGSYFAEFSSPLDPSAVPPALVESAKRFGLEIGRDVAAIKVADLPTPLLLGFQPESVSVPADVEELSLHIIAWYGRGLVKEDSGVDWKTLRASQKKWNAINRVLRRDAFYEASDIVGPWKSGVPLGLAYYFLGTLDLLEGMETQPPQLDSLNSALRMFAQAASYVTQSKGRGIHPLIFNNAAVAILAKGITTENAAKGRNWLQRAVNSAQREKNLSIGTRAALINLVTFDREVAE